MGARVRRRDAAAGHARPQGVKGRAATARRRLPAPLHAPQGRAGVGTHADPQVRMGTRCARPPDRTRARMTGSARPQRWIPLVGGGAKTLTSELVD